MPIRAKPTPSYRPTGLSEEDTLAWDRMVQAAGRLSAATHAREAERERLRAMPPEYVLTLVHGTRLPFTSKAEWISPSSQLATELTEKLGWRVAVEPFDWGGGNSAKARARGAVKLRAHLAAMRTEKKYEGARHVVIAHSHGGNVALTAMNSPTEAGGILGVVTLGTPFLSASEREIDVPLDLGSSVFSALASGFSVVVMGAAFGNGWTWWTWGGLAAAVVAVALVAGVWLTERMRRHATRTFEGMPRTKLSPDQLLIIRTTGDEAAAVLSGARVAGACLDVGWRMFSEPVIKGIGALLEKWDYLGLKAFDREFARTFEKRDDLPPVLPRSWRDSLNPKEDPVSVTGALVKYGLPVAGPLVTVWFQQPQDSAGRWALALIALVYGLPALLALAITVMSVPFAAMLAFGLLPSGWTLPFAGPFLDVTAEPAPPGTWTVTQIEPGRGQGLSHSKSYEDDRVFDAIAEWVKDKRPPAGAVTPSP